MIIIDLHVSIQFKFELSIFLRGQHSLREKHRSSLILFRGSRSQGTRTSQIENVNRRFDPFHNTFDMNALEIRYSDTQSPCLQKAT